MTRAEAESDAPQDSFSVLPRSLLWSFTAKMVGVGLFCFHIFFFVRPRHNEASGPGMGGEGSERVNETTKVRTKSDSDGDFLWLKLFFSSRDSYWS